jgi:hypothetical protein
MRVGVWGGVGGQVSAALQHVRLPGTHVVLHQEMRRALCMLSGDYRQTCILVLFLLREGVREDTFSHQDWHCLPGDKPTARDCCTSQWMEPLLQAAFCCGGPS